MNNRARLVLCTIVVIGCGQHGPPLRSPADDHRPIAGNAFWVLADSQFNNISGRNVFGQRDDAIEEVAIRPPTLDIWSEAVLAQTVAKLAAARIPLLFLGDGANTSCLGEYVRFLDVMNGRISHGAVSHGDTNWVGVIGNHDGYFMGNDSFMEGVSSPWKSACADDYQPASALRDELAKWEVDRFGVAREATFTQQGALSKATAIGLYLHDLYVRQLIADDPIDITAANYKTLWTKRGDGYEYAAVFKLTAVGALVRLNAFIADPAGSAYRAGDVEWKAFLLQDVELPSVEPTHALLIDTSDFLVRPPSSFTLPGLRCNRFENVCSLPGELGRVEELQAESIDQYVSDFRHRGIDFFVAGHHDWQSLSAIAAENLGKAIESPSFVTYLSAHTHDPTATGGFGSQEQWEINVASVTDWPMQYAKIEYWRAVDHGVPSTDLAVTVDNDYSESTGGGGPKCDLGAHDPKDGAREVSYYGRGYELRIREQYRKLFAMLARKVPPDLVTTTCDATCWRAKLDARIKTVNQDGLQALAAFDRTELRAAPSIVNLEVRCAAWASHEERAVRVGRLKGMIHAAKRAWSIVTTLHSSPTLVEKKPIDHGLLLEPGTTRFRVHHDQR